MSQKLKCIQTPTKLVDHQITKHFLSNMLVKDLKCLSIKPICKNGVCANMHYRHLITLNF